MTERRQGDRALEKANGRIWFMALVALFFPIAAEAVPAWCIFAFFSAFMVLHLLWAIFLVPETKGRSLESFENAVS